MQLRMPIVDRTAAQTILQQTIAPPSLATTSQFPLEDNQ
jgi:hypothetical protein